MADDKYADGATQGNAKILAAKPGSAADIYVHTSPIRVVVNLGDDLDVGHPEGRIVFSRGRFRITRH